MSKAMKYATLEEDDGSNYRDIAGAMTILGYPMNHSSARNGVIRVMKKFVERLNDRWGLDLDDEQIEEIARNPLFQSGMADKLHTLWSTEGDDTLFTQKG